MEFTEVRIICNTRATPMVRVTVWLQLLLVVLILRQSAAVSDQCSELQEEISRLERDIVSITELKLKNEFQADNCDEHLTKKILILEATSRKIKLSEAVISGLIKYLDEYILKCTLFKPFKIKEEVLRNKNVTQTQLQTTIDGLTKTVDSLNQAIQRQCETQEHVCRYLLDAARSGDVNIVKMLFKCSNDSCTDDEKDRNTPLSYAAKYGHLEVVQVLLNWGANVGPVDKWEDTPLHYAAVEGHLSVVKLLVERGADVRVQNKYSQTACDVARLSEHKDIADWLNSFACRYLLHAARSGDVNTVKMLFKCSNDKCTDDHVYPHTPLMYAAIYGHVKVVRVLLEGGANVDRANAEQYTALHYAASKGHLDVCRLLLDWGAKVDHLNRGKNTPLHIAAGNGHLSVVKLLLERGADVSVRNNNGRTASDLARNNGEIYVAFWLDTVCQSLLDAAKSGDVNTAKMLFKYSNDNCTDKGGDTPLTYAARYGHVELMRVLLEDGANVDRATAGGRTALSIAASNGLLDVCRLLLDWGAMVDRLDRWTSTPLSDAAWKGHLSVVKLLLDSGADVRKKDMVGWTVLHYAAHQGYLSVVKLLVERGACVSVKGIGGDTALNVAARNGHLSVVKLLVEKGADVNVKDDYGRTASDVARRTGKQDVADWLDSVCQEIFDAAKSGDVNTVKILFKYSNDNCTYDSSFRNTPLTYAAGYGYVEVVRVLLKDGANVDRANADQDTALHVAALYGHLDV